ncbi:MAG: hypothetical protein AUG83_00465 [Acidobacteria bacterium 13_1_20CM_4_57_11]|nr:MAG: hypothetical protein AUG83_00465 [Acidobacteria bacterium 13_1_20CM_4_57_11]
MNILKATADFERWLANRLPIIRQDIALKHPHMAEAPFSFFRATFYRWIQLWPEVCADLAKAPAVLAIGDLHIENFGTWRDEEGRLIWGVNDLDEAWPASYALDLVRLTTSAYLAISAEHLSLTRREAADAIEEGYRDALNAGGKAFVLAEPRSPYQLRRRIAGLGSLGHPRILALSSRHGAFIAREAKGIRTSAWAWCRGISSEEVYGAKLVDRSVRVKDPFVRFHGHWLVRRLAPDCSRIELASLPKERDEARLLYDMGWETANIHFGSSAAIAKVKKDLSSRKGRWLHKAAKSMHKATLKDWEHWREDWKGSAQR